MNFLIELAFVATLLFGLAASFKYLEVFSKLFPTPFYFLLPIFGIIISLLSFFLPYYIAVGSDSFRALKIYITVSVFIFIYQLLFRQVFLFSREAKDKFSVLSLWQTSSPDMIYGSLYILTGVVSLLSILYACSITFFDWTNPDKKPWIVFYAFILPNSISYIFLFYSTFKVLASKYVYNTMKLFSFVSSFSTLFITTIFVAEPFKQYESFYVNHGIPAIDYRVVYISLAAFFILSLVFWLIGSIGHNANVKFLKRRRLEVVKNLQEELSGTSLTSESRSAGLAGITDEFNAFSANPVYTVYIAWLIANQFPNDGKVLASISSGEIGSSDDIRVNKLVKLFFTDSSDLQVIKATSPFNSSFVPVIVALLEKSGSSLKMWDARAKHLHDLFQIFIRIPEVASDIGRPVSKSEFLEILRVNSENWSKEVDTEKGIFLELLKLLATLCGAVSSIFGAVTALASLGIKYSSTIQSVFSK